MITAAKPAWIEELRRRGIERFKEVGYPSNQQENWRQTNVAPIARTKFVPAQANQDLTDNDIRPFSFRDEASCELVFVNGYFAPRLSDLSSVPAGLRVASLASQLESGSERLRAHLGHYANLEANPFVALNTGGLNDGAVVYLDRAVISERPIHLLFISTPGSMPAVSHPRVLVLADNNVEATIVETYAGIGAGPYFANTVTEIVVGENSVIDHCRVQQETKQAFHVSTTQVKLGRSSTFVSHSASLGGSLVRNDLNVILAGEGAEAVLNGLVMISGEQHVDNHTLLDHAAAHCPSHELYKHILSGSATGVFHGKILVRPGAQKTDSKQTSRSLLLSDLADMHSQPALEIYADDVKCTHGSTTGPVDEEMVFYLQSRGVSLEAARHLLTYAFAADITRRIRIEPVRRFLENYMAAQHDLPQDLRITDLGRYDEKHR